LTGDAGRGCGDASCALLSIWAAYVARFGSPGGSFSLELTDAVFDHSNVLVENLYRSADIEIFPLVVDLSSQGLPVMPEILQRAAIVQPYIAFDDRFNCKRHSKFP
jgi:hypothetical protein